MSTHFPLRRLFATALLTGAVAVAATGCGDDASGTAQSAEPAPVAEPWAPASPAERLKAAVAQTLNAGPTRVTSDVNGIVTEAQVDYSQRVVYISIGDPSSSVQKLLSRGDVLYMLPGEGAHDDLEPGTWYRLPNEEGATQMLAKSFDPDRVTKLILSSRAIVHNGRKDIGGGVFATHFFVTPDPEAMVDVAMESLPEAMKSSGTDVREAIRSELPSRMHYWVDDSGYLVQEYDGFQVKMYHSFGEPLDLPEFDEAAVEVLPGA
ncbi:hypothetical protein [Rhodococcus sp. OK302]|uniref:hypothetical protein n=1 Tax=Rhodococcus sp. OK302 TaxID=1882769 RepID=UPI000B940BBF|nr:hypothetical protein [Rhodococcus sp. OK302]OYD60742.1 hypothetical protein BDB13_5615 [Rhodococcus sp. OK302]